MSDIWFHQVGNITINIPEIEKLANAMNRVADELAKANNQCNGKHIKLEDKEQIKN